MEIIHPLAQSYAEIYTSAEDDLLRLIREETFASHTDPHMLSGHNQGKLLELISKIVQPQTILEIGTFTGYSALCLEKGLKPGGKLHTIELRESDADISLANFYRANKSDRIILHRGNALEIIPELPGPFDLVFIDADKPAYIDYFKLVLPKMNTGGLILADNVLFHGQVLEEPVKGKNAKAIQAFNEFIQKDERVDQVVLTIRDGLMLIRKK